MSFACLTRIVANTDTFKNMQLDLLQFGGIRTYTIAGQTHYYLNSKQLLPLLMAGVEFEYYYTSPQINPQWPLLPENMLVKKIEHDDLPGEKFRDIERLLYVGLMQGLANRQSNYNGKR